MFPLIPIPLDDCPIEYEQQINIVIKTINIGLVGFIFQFPPSRVITITHWRYKSVLSSKICPRKTESSLISPYHLFLYVGPDSMADSLLSE